MAWLGRLPLLLVYPLIAGLLMLVPAAHASATGEAAIARAFFYSGILLLILTGMMVIATANMPPSTPARSHLRAFVFSYLFLPPILAVPFREAIGDTSYLNAWWEMVSAYTTTGATLYTPGRLQGPLHLWRGLVGWAGGFNILVATATILASLNLGGFELWSTRAFGRARSEQTASWYDHGQRLWDHAVRLLPFYLGITVALWAVLHALGDTELVALMHAMAVISTSGISPVGGLAGAQSGLVGEMMLALVLLIALSRRLTPGVDWFEAQMPIWRDPELRVAAAVILSSAAALSLRHLIVDTGSAPSGIGDALWALWGGLFTVLSFLTTTGFASDGWTQTQTWSALTAPWLLLLGLSMIGGGVATTTGGVKLLRVYALYVLCRREMDRLSEPSSVGGGGPMMRQLRGEGAIYAFIFFMLFAMTLGVTNLVLAMLDLPFQTALVLSVAALTTTGPMPGVTRIADLDWAGLGTAAKVTLAGCMILGRLETLAVIAFLLPSAWRR